MKNSLIERYYFGVAYYKDDGLWFCDLTNEGFDTKKNVMTYIKDWYQNS